MISKARSILGGFMSYWADRLLYGNGHDIIIKDGQGQEVCTMWVPGGWIANTPVPPYTMECCEVEV